MPQRPAPAGSVDPYSRFDEPTGTFGGGFDSPPPPPRGGRPSFPGPDDRFEGFDPPRHGKMDMTAEIRLPEREGRGGGPAMSPGAPMNPAAPLGMGPSGPPPMGPAGGDVARVDHMRRSFQVRRFGSGYDPAQVDRLFDGVLAAMTGRGPMPPNDSDLDSTQFGLVPGGYFEAEVDAALKEVRDILRRR